jgi:hypothetical protein
MPLGYKRQIKGKEVVVFSAWFWYIPLCELLNDNLMNVHWEEFEDERFFLCVDDVVHERSRCGLQN